MRYCSGQGDARTRSGCFYGTEAAGTALRSVPSTLSARRWPVLVRRSMRRPVTPSPSAGASSGAIAHIPGARARFPSFVGAHASVCGLSGSRDRPLLPLELRRARPSSFSPSHALAAQKAPPGSPPSSGVLPSRVCRVGEVAAAPPAAVARFARLAGLGLNPREYGGHGQGVSCTDKKTDN